MTALGELVEMTFGYAFQSRDFTDDPADVRLLRGDNVGQGVLRWDGAKRYPQHLARDFDAYRLVPGDVVLAMDRPWIEAGLKYAVLREADTPSLLVQRVVRLRARPGLDQGYLAYVIGGKAFTDHVRGVETGSAVPHISGKQVAEFNLERVPPIEEQRDIAATLGAIDDKIDSNRRAHSLWLQLSRTLWLAETSRRSVTASTVLTPVLGGTPKRNVPAYWNGHIPWASASDVVGAESGLLVQTAEMITELGVANSAAKILPAGTIVMTARGTVGAVARLAIPMAFNQSCYALVPKSGLDPGVLFIALVEAIHRIRNAGHGTVFNTVNMATFDQIPLDLPQDEHGQLAAALAALTERMLVAERESLMLASLRDALLPELMSGRIRVTQVAGGLEAATV